MSAASSRRAANSDASITRSPSVEGMYTTHSSGRCVSPFGRRSNGSEDTHSPSISKRAISGRSVFRATVVLLLVFGRRSSPRASLRRQPPHLTVRPGAGDKGTVTLDDRIDELYGLPLDRFTPERDALA